MSVFKFPLTKITLCFVGGIFFGNYFSFNPRSILFVLFALLLLLSISYLFNKKSDQFHFTFAIITFFISILLGIFSITNNFEIHDSKHYIHFVTETEKNQVLEIEIKEKLKSNAYNERWIGCAKKLNGNESLGKIIINFKKHCFNKNAIGIGTKIKTTCSIQKNKNNTSIGQFNYSQYLKNKAVYGQIYPTADQIKISPHSVKTLNYYAAAFRERIIENLKKNGFHEKELNIIIALLLGQQQEISKDVLQDYRYAGAVHILSVSGLHVGLIMAFVTFLLGFFPNTNNWRFIKLALLVIALWLFAIVAGLAPCVVRSVTMFSFLAVGKYLNRETNSYHTLLISLLIILFFEPSFLFDVGFQLSYIALFFIIWLQPFFSTFWMPKNKIIKYFWDIVTVSFAAQIGSFPIITYHFHQFPGLFFATNLIVLPFLSIIMLLGLVVVIMAFFDCIWLSAMHLLEKCLQILNQTIGWIASFEDFIFKDISFNLPMLLGTYILIFSWFIWMKKPSYRGFIFSLSTAISLLLIFVFTKYASQTSCEFVVFNNAKNALFTERGGQNVSVFTNPNRLKDIEKNSNLTAYLIENFSSIKTKKIVSNFYLFDNKKIMIIDSSAVFLDNQKTDVLLLCGSPKINLDRVLNSCKPKVVVADGSNYKNSIAHWNISCMKQKIPFHNTRELGCFVLKKNN